MKNSHIWTRSRIPLIIEPVEVGFRLNDLTLGDGTLKPLAILYFILENYIEEDILKKNVQRNYLKPASLLCFLQIGMQGSIFTPF